MSGKRIISRRIFLAAATALAGGAVYAQPKEGDSRGGSLRRIGYLSGATEQANAGYLRRFRAGMADLHWREGKDYEFLPRYTNGVMGRLPSTAQELVALRPDVVLAPGFLSTRALANATKTIPIVFLAIIDPVGSGLVASLSKPGGNLTGFSEVSQDLSAKRVQLLSETVLNLKLLAILFAPEIPTNPPLANLAEKAAKSLGIGVTRIELRESADVDAAVRRAASNGAQAFVVFASGLTQARRGKLVEESLALRIPGMYYDGEFVEDGGFMSYAASPEIYRRAATIVDKILRGGKPSDIPVEQPTSFELMINLKTAAMLGISVPGSLRSQADRLVE